MASFQYYASVKLRLELLSCLACGHFRVSPIPISPFTRFPPLHVSPLHGSPFTCFPFTRFPPFPLFCTLHIILLSLLLYHEEYHCLPFTNHHFPLYMSLHILLLIMRCEFRFGNLQEENQCKFKSNDPNAIESVNISPELRSLAQPMLHEHFLVIIRRHSRIVRILWFHFRSLYMTVYGKRGHFTQKLKLRYRLQK